jgi:polar amino acid transport system substrate-binding protein
MRSRLAHLALVGLVTGTALALAACGEQTTTPTPEGGTASEAAPSVSTDSELAAMVPEDVSADGTIVIGTDATYAPNEFLAEDGTTVQGFDVDLFDAVAAKLGLETQWQSAPFDSIITGVDSAKYEIGVSSFTINEDRLRVADMISYFSAGTAWATAKGNPSGIDPDDACGMRVAVQRGTVQVEDITARSQACAAAGKPEITIDQYQGQDQATSAVSSGKDDAMLADSPIIAYAAQQSQGAVESVGDIYDAAPYGYVVKKGQGQFADALAGAVNALIADGTYQQVLESWGVEQGAVDSAEVNPVP